MLPQRGKTHIGAQKITHRRNFPVYFHGLHEATHLPGELSLRYVCWSRCCENSFPRETWASLPSPPKDFPPNDKQNRILPKFTLADKEVLGLSLLTTVWWGFPIRARCTSKKQHWKVFMWHEWWLPCGYAKGAFSASLSMTVYLSTSLDILKSHVVREEWSTNMWEKMLGPNWGPCGPS